MVLYLRGTKLYLVTPSKTRPFLVPRVNSVTRIDHSGSLVHRTKAYWLEGVQRHRRVTPTQPPSQVDDFTSFYFHRGPSSLVDSTTVASTTGDHILWNIAVSQLNSAVKHTINNLASPDRVKVLLDRCRARGTICREI